MRLILILFIFIPFYGFSQLAAKSITGKWRGRYVLTSEIFPDGIKIKDTIRVHDTITAEFILIKIIPESLFTPVVQKSSKKQSRIYMVIKYWLVKK
jgi:hypothetical protein